MNYSWAGTVIEVDLSRGIIERRQNTPESVADYLAGKGTNAKLLWDRVPPETDAFSRENLLLVGAGLLTGTMVPGANRICITYKSPVTGLHCFSSMGGFWGAELKHAGYDTIIISGKSPTPVFLWINNDHVELRDAGHLWGKGTHKTQMIIRDEMKIDKAQIMCIGPAGENKVYHASIEHAVGASASRGGAGAVAGDKNLKAIAVYGTQDIGVANPSKLIDLCEHMLSRTGMVRTKIFEQSAFTIIQFLLRIGAYGNFSRIISPKIQQQILDMGLRAQDFIEKKRAREVGCYNCMLRCKHLYRTSNGEYTCMKCADWYTPMVATQVLDPEFAVQYTYLCEQYGLDIITTANCIAFAIDLYQKGILTKTDTDGMHLEWGNSDITFSLVEKIARREGIGDVLANGNYRAAKQIGKGSEEYAIHTKKLDARLVDGFYRAHICLIDAINEKGDPSKLDNTIYSGIFPLSREEKEAYLRDGWFPYPKEFNQYLLADVDYSGADYNADAQMTAYDTDQYTLADVTGICYYWMMFWRYPVVDSRDLVARLISAATGIEIGDVEATKITQRIANLIRGYNVRDGLRRKDDWVPKMVFERPVQPKEKFIRGFYEPNAPQRQQIDSQFLDKRISAFYNLRGWDNDGIPTKETLKKYDLDYIRQDLQQRKIIIN